MLVGFTIATWCWFLSFFHFRPILKETPCTPKTSDTILEWYYMFPKRLLGNTVNLNLRIQDSLNKQAFSMRFEYHVLNYIH